MQTDCAVSASVTNVPGEVPPWLKEAKAEVSDLARPTPLIYWVDFLLSISTGYAAAIAYLDLPGFSWLRVGCLVVASFLIFRASSFVHEIVHQRDERLNSFRIVWDLVCGIPTLFPSFTYMHHLDHHRCDSYGTKKDGEYLPFGVNPFRMIGYYFLLTFAWPLMVVFRFFFLTPISFLYPPFRPWLLERFSSFGIVNFQHRLTITPSTPLLYWAFLDIACFLRTVGPVTLIATGVMPWTRLPLLYSIAASILLLNFIRVLCLHDFLNEDEQLSYSGQLRDSLTLPHHGVVAELFVPLGLRYHAMHHLFPHLPYHALPTAHRRLMRALPAESDYHRTVRPGMAAIFLQLWRNSWAKGNPPTNTSGADSGTAVSGPPRPHLDRRTSGQNLAAAKQKTERRQ